MTPQQLPSHIWHLYGASPNEQRVVILGGTHGDELTGIELVRSWLRSIHSERNLLKETPDSYYVPGIQGSLFLGFGNPEAILKRTRSASTHRDLNRCFELNLLNDQTKSWPDLERARELRSLLETTNLLIDIHAVSIPNEQPFVCFGTDSPQHERIYTQLPIRYVLTDPDNILGQPEKTSELSTTDQIVNRSGGLGLCLETGHMDDISKLPLIQYALSALLVREGVINPHLLNRLQPPQTQLSSAKKLMTALHSQQIHRLKLSSYQPIVKPTGHQFVLEPGMGIPWTAVKKGQLYGSYPDGTQIRILEDGIIVLPIVPERIGIKQVMYYIAQPY